MKKFAWLLAIALVFTMLAPAAAAPLFPDVPAEHWARDAVASLAAQGILEGYPDGTFKGDRAATRWEMAMCVARLLAKMEQENATFATKADLEELQKLVNSLKDELAALGVRVGNLEDSVGKIDKRVTDLERIRFYGSLDTAYVSNGFKATGQGQGQSTAYYAANLLDGRTYFVGTGFTMKGIFGVRAKVSDEISAGLELAAFVSNGDDFVNNIYGISAPYMNNFFTQRTNVSADANTAMTPWTRVNLDNFWLKHNPSGLKLVVGSYDSMFSSAMYASPVNPNVNGPKFLGSYGFQVTGNTRLFSPMDYEVMYSYLPDGNKNLEQYSSSSVAYDSKAMGFNLKWNFDKGMIKIGFLRALNERRNGTVSGDVYQVYDQNGLFTPIMHWVNPAGYNCNIAANNLDPNKQAVNMIAGSTTGMNWASDGLGTEYFRVGPQGLYNLGLSGNYNFDPIRFSVDLASSTYRPNTNSDYKKNGTTLKIGLGAALMGGQLDLGLDYLSTSPYYNPMIFQYPYISDTSNPTTFPNNNMYYFRVPAFSYFPNLWQLSDSEVFPNNREGFRFKADYKFAGEDGNVCLKYDAFGQVDPSAPNVVYTQGGQNVVGFEPGFIEPFFHEVAGNGSLGSNYRALEENKGKVDHFGLDIGYKFKGAGLRADLNYHNYNFKRSTDLSATANPSAVYQNYIDFKYNTLALKLAYPFNERFCLKGGFEQATMKGHHALMGQYFDGIGGYTATPTATNAKDDNMNLVQSVPYLGFDYKLSKSTTWGLNLNFISLNDKSAGGTGTYRYAYGSNVEPFKYSGTQLFTEVKVSF